jgi:hypothetical protein
MNLAYYIYIGCLVLSNDEGTDFLAFTDKKGSCVCRNLAYILL